MKRPGHNAAVAMACLVLFACGGVSASARSSGTPELQISAPELRERLAYFYTVVMGSLESATLRAEEGEKDVQRLRVLTSAKIRALRIYRSVIFQADPTTGFFDAWALTVQIRHFLQSEPAVDEFGSAAAVLLDTFERLQLEIEAVATEFIPLPLIDETRQKLELFARENPLTSARAIKPPSPEAKAKIPGIGWLFSMPLAPFRAMDGVDRTAHAMNDLTKIADSLVQTVSSLPVEATWESELLLLQARRDVAALADDKLARLDVMARAIIDHLAIRAAQLAGLIFVVAVIYRLVAWRLMSRGAH